MPSTDATAEEDAAIAEVGTDGPGVEPAADRPELAEPVIDEPDTGDGGPTPAAVAEDDDAAESAIIEVQGDRPPASPRPTATPPAKVLARWPMRAKRSMRSTGALRTPPARRTCSPACAVPGPRRRHRLRPSRPTTSRRSPTRSSTVNPGPRQTVRTPWPRTRRRSTSCRPGRRRTRGSVRPSRRRRRAVRHRPRRRA